MFAANGDARANYNLGVMYREGFGLIRMTYEALTHFIAAAEDGHMLGNYAVGLALLRGRGSDVDAEAALFYLKEATLLDMLYRQWKLVGFILRQADRKRCCSGSFLVVTGT